MLDKMREHGGNWMVKLGLGLISLVFVFWGFGAKFGGQGGDFAVKVNGDEISERTFEQAYRQAEQQSRMQNQHLPSELEDKFVTEQALDDVIENQLLLQLAKEESISASPSEIHDQICQYSEFKDPKGGCVDDKTYQDIVENKLKMDVGDFQDGVAEGIIQQKARQFIFDSAKVTPQEVKDAFNGMSEKVDLQYVLVDEPSLKAAIDAIPVSDADLAAWTKANPGKAEQIYNEQRDTRWTVPAKAMVATITIRKPAQGAKNADDDLATAKRKADKALELAKTDFAKAADTYAEGSTEKSGTPQEKIRQDLPNKVADAVFPTDPKATEALAKEPTLVDTPTAFVIVQSHEYTAAKVTELDDKLKRSIAEEEIRKAKATDLVDSFAKKAFAELQAGKKIEDVAKEKGLAVKDTGAFARREEIPGVPDSDSKMVGAAFALAKPGAVLVLDGGIPKAGESFVLATLKTHDVPNQDDFEKQKLFVQKRLELMRGEAAFRVWKADRMAKSDIKYGDRVKAMKAS